MERRVTAYSRAERELRPDAVYAELVHQPQSRVGNIIARPVLTEYELVYLGQSGLPIDQQIPVSDLLVSVVNGRFVLRSQRLGREVIPRMTTAHTLAGGLTTFRFLGQLASEPALVLRMNALDSLPFTPRVVVGRAVLHLATWLVFRDEIAALDGATAPERFAAVQALRAQRKLPRFVAVKDLDNELPIDLDNALSVESFVHLVRQRSHARLQEVYPGADELCAEGPEGRFIHELIVPFLRGVGDASAQAPQRDRRVTLARRQFAPGSEWLYAKLYTGMTAGDRVLREVVDPIVEQGMASGACDRWFFLRYADPEFQIRVRFHGEPGAICELIPALHERCAPLVTDGLIHRVQFDTYEREIERYGGDAGIELAEQLFHADSEAVLAVIRTLDMASDLDERWRFALLGIDLLLHDLRLDLAQRRSLIGDQRAGFGAEYEVTTLFERGLGAKFRNERLQIESILAGGSDGNLAVVRDAYRRRSERSRAVVDELIERERAGRLTVPVAELAKSFIHMHANRCLRSAPRAQELVLYDFLDRSYTSQAARAKPPRRAKAEAAQAVAAQL
jgi:thiopeptide-type bacteriocin biosynthesis protein